MTVEVTNPVAGPFYPNGVTTSFPFSFKAMSASEVVVVDGDGAELVGLSYTVTLGTAEGGAVDFAAAPTAGQLAKIYIVSEPSFEQPTKYGSVSTFNPASLNNPIDRLAVQTVALNERLGRGVIVPIGEAGLALPAKSVRAGRVRVIGNDADGNIGLLDGSDFKGERGPQGYSAVTLAQLKAAPTTDGPLNYDQAVFAFLTGDYSGQADDTNTIKSDYVDLSEGAWVRQGADKVLYQAPFASATKRSSGEKHRDIVSVKDFGAIGDGVADDSAAIQAAIDEVGSSAIIYFPYGNYRCLSKLLVGRGVSSYGWTFYGQMGGYLEGNMSRVFLDPSSTDSTLFELDQASGVHFVGMSLQGKASGATGPGTSVITATDINADVDLDLQMCTIGTAETLIKLTGRGLHASNCYFILGLHVLELNWPDPFVSLGNDNHYPKSGMRAYKMINNRFHGMSGGFIVQNNGANAKNITSFLLAGNYSDNNIRVWDGPANNLLVADNIFIETSGGDGTAPLFDIPASLPSGAVSSRDITITGNKFTGQLDDSYEVGGNPSVADRFYANLGIFYNVSGLKIVDNTLERVAREAINMVSCSNVTIRGNTLREVSLDAARSLTLSTVSAPFVAGETVTGGTSGATGTVAYPTVGVMRLYGVTGTFAATETITGGTSGSTAVVSSTALTARYPIKFSGTCADIDVEGNHVISTIDPDIPVIYTTGATITNLRIGKQFFDPAKWSLTDYEYKKSEWTDTGIVADDGVYSAALGVTGRTVGIQVVSITGGDYACWTGTISNDTLQSIAGAGGGAVTWAALQAATTLTGTTGTDTQVTLAIDSSGKFQIENRDGAARAFRWRVF